MRIAIISFFHAESSLCLAKHIARLGHQVDYYYVAGLYHTVDYTPGFEYQGATHILGNHLLKHSVIPELKGYLDGLPVRIYLTRILHHDQFPRFNNWLVKLLFQQVKLRHYDAINVVGQYSKVNIAHEVFRTENLIHTFHEIGNHDGELVPLNIVKRAIEDNTKVILHSHALHERFLSINGSIPGRTRMIPFGKFETCKLYTNECNVNLPFPKVKPIFLFYGYMAEYKGLDVLSKAMNLLRDVSDKFCLLIAGSGENTNLNDLRAYENCYIINRFLSNDEMMAYIKESSVILLPYKTASQTGIIPTCTLYGKPFIATRVGAFPEMVIDGYNGLLIEPNNPRELASGIRKMIEEPYLIKRVSDGAANFGCGDKYDWESIALQTIEFYKQ